MRRYNPSWPSLISYPSLIQSITIYFWTTTPRLGMGGISFFWGISNQCWQIKEKLCPKYPFCGVSQASTLSKASTCSQLLLNIYMKSPGEVIHLHCLVNPWQDTKVPYIRLTLKNHAEAAIDLKYTSEQLWKHFGASLEQHFTSTL